MLAIQLAAGSRPYSYRFNATASHEEAALQDAVCVKSVAGKLPEPVAATYPVEIKDERVLNWLQQLPSDKARAEQLTRAVELGFLAMQTAQPHDAVVQIQQRFDKLEARLEEALRLLDDATTAAEGKIQGQVNSVVRDTGHDMLRAFADLRADAAGLVAQLRGQVALIHAEIQALKELEEKSGPVAGSRYEDRLLSALETFAKSRREQVAYTGDTPGTHGKVGDLVYILNVDGQPVRVVLEAKNRTCTRDGKEAYFLDELDLAMQNRGCSYGIVVASRQKNSTESGRSHIPVFQEMPGNRFVVLVDEKVSEPVALETALLAIHRLERARLRAGVNTVDLAALQSAMGMAVQCGLSLDPLKAGLKKEIATLQGLLDMTDKLERDLNHHLQEAQRLVQGRESLRENLAA